MGGVGQTVNGTSAVQANSHLLSFDVIQDQWEAEHNGKQTDLEKKYQENLAEVGLGHKTASEVTVMHSNKLPFWTKILGIQ